MWVHRQRASVTPQWSRPTSGRSTLVCTRGGLTWYVPQWSRPTSGRSTPLLMPGPAIKGTPQWSRPTSGRSTPGSGSRPANPNGRNGAGRRAAGAPGTLAQVKRDYPPAAMEPADERPEH